MVKSELFFIESEYDLFQEKLKEFIESVNHYEITVDEIEHYHFALRLVIDIVELVSEETEELIKKHAFVRI